MSKYIQVDRHYKKELSQGFIAKVPDDWTPEMVKALPNLYDLIAEEDEEELHWEDGELVVKEIEPSEWAKGYAIDILNPPTDEEGDEDE